jgi:hypothetical protein
LTVWIPPLLLHKTKSNRRDLPFPNFWDAFKRVPLPCLLAEGQKTSYEKKKISPLRKYETR